MSLAHALRYRNLNPVERRRSIGLAVGTAVHRGRVRQTLGATVRIAAGGQAALAEIEADRTFAYAPAIAIGAALAAIGV